MHTTTQKESMEFLKSRARGETENKDNTFLIDIKGRIIGHGYHTPGSWFEWGDLKGAEITIELGTKVKDILANVRLAKKACREGSYNIEYAR